MVTVNGNPNPTNPTYPTNPTNPTNPTTKYRCEFVNLFCIYAQMTYEALHSGLFSPPLLFLLFHEATPSNPAYV